MEPSYKDFTSSRGVKYHYYCSRPSDGKPYLGFFHGFPSTSRDWKYQIDFFKGQGYGLIVPDLLGFGGSDKPKDAEEYKWSMMTKDFVELLDSEGAAQIIAIGHDWGSVAVSRLAARYQSRFLAFAFLAAGYAPPSPTFDYHQVMATNQGLFGNDLLGYWEFMDEEDAEKFALDHYDSIYSLLFAEDASLWFKHVGPKGAMKEFMAKDTIVPIANYMDPQDKGIRKKEFTESNLAGMNYYRILTRGITPKDDADIPQEQYMINKPTFFGATLRDQVCRPEFGKMIMPKLCPNTTYVDFDTDHWVMLAAPDQLNQELLKWVSDMQTAKL